VGRERDRGRKIDEKVESIYLVKKCFHFALFYLSSFPTVRIKLSSRKGGGVRICIMRVLEFRR
jgi:hypothetical protein